MIEKDTKKKKIPVPMCITDWLVPDNIVIFTIWAMFNRYLREDETSGMNVFTS